jgi:hypothetical protein
MYPEELFCGQSRVRERFQAWYQASAFFRAGDLQSERAPRGEVPAGFYLPLWNDGLITVATTSGETATGLGSR